jgi:hypothetical protein
LEAGAGALRRAGGAGPVDWREWAGKTIAGTVFDQPEPEELIELTVIVPARNEEDCLGACLQSLVSQSEEIFELGKDWELIVVDDHSTDRTAEIARGFAGVTVMEAAKLEPGWTGKANAIWTAAKRRGAGGCSLPTRTRFTSRATCAGRCTRRSGTRRDAELLAAADCERAGAAVADAAGLLRTGAGLSAGQGLRPEPAHRRGQRAVSAGGAGGLPALGGHASVADKVLEDVELAFWPSGARWGCASAMPTTPWPRACTGRRRR